MDTKCKYFHFWCFAILYKNMHLPFLHFCVLCHKYCTNYDLDWLSTSKWLSGSQFCNRFIHIYSKKMATNSWKMVLIERHSFRNSLHEPFKNFRALRLFVYLPALGLLSTKWVNIGSILFIAILFRIFGSTLTPKAVFWKLKYDNDEKKYIHCCV